MRELNIITHLGLGDLILQSGLACHLAKEYDRVYFPCRERDLNSVRSFFLLQPKVDVVVGTMEDSTTPKGWFVRPGDQLLLGFYSQQGMDNSISFSENFYRQAGVDYSVRWDECPIQEVVDKFYNACNMTGYGYFIHEDKKKGFKIRHHGQATNDIHAVSIPASLLAYSSSFIYCPEIHVIDGPFLHLAESIETRGELFYHKYARPLSARWNDLDCPTRKKWTVLS